MQDTIKELESKIALSIGVLKKQSSASLNQDFKNIGKSSVAAVDSLHQLIAINSDIIRGNKIETIGKIDGDIGKIKGNIQKIKKGLENDLSDVTVDLRLEAAEDRKEYKTSIESILEAQRQQKVLNDSHANKLVELDNDIEKISNFPKRVFKLEAELNTQEVTLSTHISDIEKRHLDSSVEKDTQIKILTDTLNEQKTLIETQSDKITDLDNKIKGFSNFGSELDKIKEVHNHWAGHAKEANIGFKKNFRTATATLSVFMVIMVSVAILSITSLGDKVGISSFNEIAPVVSAAAPTEKVAAQSSKVKAVKPVDVQGTQASAEQVEAAAQTVKSIEKPEGKSGLINPVGETKKSDTQVKAGEETTSWSDIVKYFVLAPTTLFGIWLIRIFLQQALRYREAAFDAKERETMVKTYLYLVASGKDVLEPKERELILKPLFTLSTHPTSYEDGAPTTLLEKLLTKKV